VDGDAISATNRRFQKAHFDETLDHLHGDCPWCYRPVSAEARICSRGVPEALTNQGPALAAFRDTNPVATTDNDVYVAVRG
jgi:hypothetical protein